MNASDISTGLEAIVAAIPDSVFLRATDADASTDVDRIDLSGKTIFIYNNLPTVDHPQVQGGSVFRSWPVEIRILRLADFDDNTVQGDALRDICIAGADAVYDKLPTQFSDLPVPSTYSLNLLGEVKVYDKTLTGVRLTFTLSALRTTYYC
jgi:hypothetical protein